MTQKPQQASGYEPGFSALVRSACLTVASRLGDLTDAIVIVGGLVPSLLLDQGGIPEPERHVGTRDVDVGLTVSLMDGERYAEIGDRLRAAGFTPDKNPTTGQPTPQRWISSAPRITVEFLIEPGDAPNDHPGRVWKMREDLGAFTIPGIEMAFRDAELVTLEGQTLDGVKATCEMLVCGPGAFILLKALAFGNRHEPKDAYDLHFMLTHHPDGVPDIAHRIRSLLPDANAERALEQLRSDYASLDHIGPRYAARFVQRDEDEGYRADVKGAVDELLRQVERGV